MAMTQKLIDKAAVVAGIEDKINKYTKRGEESDAKRDGYGMYWGGVLSCLNEVRSFLDTLKVKEVDLDKEIEKEIETRWYGEYLSTEKFKESAKHFFELGLKAQKGE